MKNIARQYLCAFCHKQITICSGCDRGNVYCGSICSKEARKVSVRKAGRKYQNKQQGKLKHAKRQKRYLFRLKKIMTHHSSKPLPTHDLLPPKIDKPRDRPENKKITSDDRCHFCGSIIDKRVFDGTH